MSGGVETRGLTRRFGRRAALAEVSFTLPGGGFLLATGENGAGKTTLLRVLAGLTSATSGDAFVAGADVRREPQRVRHAVGLVAHAPLLFADLTAAENLVFYGRMYGRTDAPRRAAALLDRMGLSARADEPVRDLSRGMRQRVALARALMHEPRVLLLDEPYAGLDQRGAAVLDTVLDELHRRATVVLVTHDPGRPRTWATHALALKGGKVQVWEELGQSGPRAARSVESAAEGSAGDVDAPG